MILLKTINPLISIALLAIVSLFCLFMLILAIIILTDVYRERKKGKKSKRDLVFALGVLAFVLLYGQILYGRWFDLIDML